MGIDITTEALLSLSEAAKTLPGRPHASSIFRWLTRGVRGVRLESTLVGGRRYTSQEALVRFCAAITAAAADELAPVRTPARRERDFQRAEREMGIALRATNKEKQW